MLMFVKFRAGGTLLDSRAAAAEPKTKVIIAAPSPMGKREEDLQPIVMILPPEKKEKKSRLTRFEI